MKWNKRNICKNIANISEKLMESKQIKAVVKVKEDENSEIEKVNESSLISSESDSTSRDSKSSLMFLKTTEKSQGKLQDADTKKFSLS